MYEVPDEVPISAEGIQFSPEDSAIVCFRCGLCCTYYRVFLSMEEAQRIADYAGVLVGEFIEEYGELHWYAQKDLLLSQQNGGCFFLERVPGTKEARCRIHPVKPAPCREWAPGLYRRECQRGLAEYWNLVINAAGQLEGTEEDVKKFNSFLKLLSDEEKKTNP